MGDVHRAFHRRLRARDDRYRSRTDSVGNEVFAIDAQALKGAEDGSGRYFPIVDRKARHHRFQRRAGIDPGVQPIDQRSQAHQ